VAGSVTGLQYRTASAADVALLARMNRQLIEDEGYRNRMTLEMLREAPSLLNSCISLEGEKDAPLCHFLIRVRCNSRRICVSAVC
jgi:hypothetical protein